MNKIERLNLVAPCGIDCGICELHTCKDDPQLMNQYIGLGVPKEVLPCAGCRSIKGQCPVMQDICATYTCVENKEVAFCSECDDFPCSKIQPCLDRANTLPHNMKLYNLCTIQKSGLEGLIKQSSELKLKYFKGKIRLGAGPVI